jgi:hypothetical protein
MSMGFSQKIALPARAAPWIRSKWVSVGVPMTTASMSSAREDGLGVRTSAPTSAAKRSAASGIASDTATTVPRRPCP